MHKYITIAKFPTELYQQTKRYALDKGKTLREVFIEAIQRLLKEDL